MKIAIDAREASGKPTGPGRYLMNLLATWISSGILGQDHQLTLYFDNDPPAKDFISHQAVTSIVLPQWPEIIPGRDTLWQQLTLARRLRRDRPDRFFSPAYLLPLRLPCPAAVSVHDISFEAHPEWFPRRQALRRRQICRKSCQRAVLILAPSQFTRSELIKYYGVAPEKIKVVPLASDARFQPSESPARDTKLRNTYGIRGRVVLHAGTILNRRLIPQLLEAFAQALRADPNLTLVFAGENRSWPRIEIFPLAEKLGIDDRVVVLGYVSDEELAAFYNLAQLTVYLSEYEGFGFPPLESIASGCPVVTSASSSLTEHFEGMALLHQGKDPGSLAQALLDQLAVSQMETWEDRRARSILACQRFSWLQTATSTLNHLRQVLVGEN